MGEVKRLAYYMPVIVLGIDQDTARTYVMCPCCMDPAPVAADGSIVCALSEAVRRVFAEAWRSFQ